MRERGSGSLIRRGRIWYAVVSERGRKRRRSTGETERPKAERFLRRWRAEIELGVVRPKAGKLTLGDLLDGLERDWAARGLKSARYFRWWAAPVLDWFGADCPVDRLDPRALERYVLERRRAGVPQNTYRLGVHLIVAGMALAVRQGVLPSSAHTGIRGIPEDRSRARQGFLSPEQIDRLLAALEPALADLIEFLAYSGWRASEARGLLWRDVSLETGEIRLGVGRTKERRPRVLPIAGRIGQVIERRRRERRLDLRVVFHRDGRPIGDVRKSLATACQTAGIDRIGLHDLRRSFVRMAAEAGLDQATIMAYTGHKSDEVFRRYRIVDLSSMRGAAEVLSGSRPARGRLPR